MGRAFKSATMAIDPKDGKVANRVVSRNLTFVK
jgi:hypothetical protein